MRYEEAFLQDILENREDDTPRRIYADWLMDQADPVSAARGEFIHVQCDAARAPASRAPGLARRERELLEAHAREWGSKFSRLGCVCWEYRRGFVEGVGLPATALLSQAGTLFRAAPIEGLKLYGSSGLWADLAGCAHLSRVRSLDLEKNELSDADLDQLETSPHLERVETLMLWSNQISDDGVRALLRAALPRLARLDLSDNIVSDAGAEALAVSELFGRLKLLDLTGNQVRDAGALALLRSPRAAGLAWLELGKNNLSLGVQNALREWHASRAVAAE